MAIDVDVVETPPPSRVRLGEGQREFISLLTKNPVTVVAAVLLVLIALVAIFAYQIAPHPEDATGATNLTERLQPPSWSHFFGTDQLGRDVFSRVLIGAQTSLTSGMIPIVVAAIVGLPAGAIAGYFGGWIDSAIMRVTDVLISLPRLVLAIAIGAALGPSLKNAMLALTIVWTPFYVRMIYGQAQSLRQEVYVEAARQLGVPSWKIILRHILPNCASTMIVVFTMDLGFGILTMASLGFVGVGAQPPSPEWGAAVAEGRSSMPDWWWISVFPGAAICLVVVIFNILGEGLRDALDPHARK
jgi:peptide/nickel transport system permease protein